MKYTKFLLYLLAFGMLFFSACSDDDDDNNQDPAINESEVLANFLESNDSPAGKDYANTDLPSIIPATEVQALNATNQIYIMDIRAAADFNAGRIANAVNVAPGDVLNHIESVDLSGYTKVAIVCYTGQTAGWAASLLRLMGYDKVFSMKWGMCSWHDDFAGKWNSNVGNAYATQMTGDVTEKGAMVDMPALSTGKTTGMEILEARVAAVLTEGFDAAKVSNQTVFDNLSDYYIVNYWPEGQYLDPGHIPGASQYTPKGSMKMSEYLKTLPTDKPIAVYCYTGQTSAFMSAYLRLLGYDAKSLLFGTNGMMWNACNEAGMTVWSESQIMGYDYVQ
jgi:rhodanese-related sulfurtransferase